jgi:HAD superfamily hydrolase (TIGR01549 family)
MRPFEACLLDYGNTIVEFDRRQLDFIRGRLTASFSRLIGPIEPSVLAEVLDRACSLPYAGSPPTFRELTPLEQMAVVLREAYGNDRELPPDLVVECNRVLQNLFVESITIEMETLELLSALSRRLRVGLVSNYPCGEAIRRSLKKVGIDGLLDPVVVSGEVGFVKPHPAPFAAALELLAVPPEKVLFVGDRWDVDMLGARDAGMKTCHHLGFTLDRDVEARYKAYRPDFQIQRLEELEGMV